MIARAVLPEALRAQIAAEASAAFPRECCGLLEGRRLGDALEVVAAHAARNLSEATDRFEIDPADHFRLLRGCRERATEIVGCYHSHPNGNTEPSVRDLAGAGEEGFLWLIAAVSERAAPVIAGFVFADGAFRDVEIVPG